MVSREDAKKRRCRSCREAAFFLHDAVRSQRWAERAALRPRASLFVPSRLRAKHKSSHVVSERTSPLKNSAPLVTRAERCCISPGPFLQSRYPSLLSTAQRVPGGEVDDGGWISLRI